MRALLRRACTQPRRSIPLAVRATPAAAAGSMGALAGSVYGVPSLPIRRTPSVGEVFGSLVKEEVRRERATRRPRTSSMLAACIDGRPPFIV